MRTSFLLGLLLSSALIHCGSDPTHGDANAPGSGAAAGNGGAGAGSETGGGGSGAAGGGTLCQLSAQPPDAQASGQGYFTDPISLSVDFGVGDVHWERRLLYPQSQNEAWQPIPDGTGNTLVLATPDWVAVRSEYRAVCEDGASTAAIHIVEPTLTGLDPIDFGAIGDGVADDTAALNATANAAAAAGDGVNLAGRTYRTTDYWVVKNGVSAIFDGTIVPTGTNTGIMLPRPGQLGAVANLEDLVLLRVTVDTAAGGTYGLRAEAPTRVAVVDSHFLNRITPGYSIAFNASQAGARDMEDILIVGCTFTGSIGESDSASETIHIGAESIIPSAYPSTLEAWKGDKVTPPPYFRNVRPRILCNDIQGGYYGVGLSHAEDFEIGFNSVRDNVRNLSNQNLSRRGVIHHNILVNAKSTSVHIAYGSSDNEVAFNTITSDRLENAALQTYVDCDRNHIHDNTATVGGPGPRMFLHCSVHADDNVFERNTYNGPLTRVGILHEAAWDSTNHHIAHRGAWAGAVVDNFSAANSTNNIFRDNTITTPSNVEPMCVSSITDAYGVWHVTSFEQTNNLFNGQPLTPHVYLDD